MFRLLTITLLNVFFPIGLNLVVSLSANSVSQSTIMNWNAVYSSGAVGAPQASRYVSIEEHREKVHSLIKKLYAKQVLKVELQLWPHTLKQTLTLIQGNSCILNS